MRLTLLEAPDWQNMTGDFTFVADAVEANVACMTRGEPGSYFNIGGGSRVTLNHCLDILREVTGREVRIARHDAQHGDVRHTWADTTAAQTVLGFQPRVTLREGLAAEDAWFRDVVLARRLG